MVRIQAPVLLCLLRLLGCHSLGESLRFIQETSWKLSSRAPLIHTLLLIRINQQSRLLGQEPVYTPQRKEKGRRPKEKGGERPLNFLPTKFTGHLLGDPYLCGWCKHRSKPVLLELIPLGLSPSQNLYHAARLPQKALFNFYFYLRSVCIFSWAPEHLLRE